MKPLILVTNDDGIASPGLNAAIEALMPMAELLVVAPRSQQTNMGRGSLKGETVGRLERRTMVINGRSIDAYAVEGSPAQAVAHALVEIADRKPDLCVSGINYGENLGLALTCSGTVGAAFEAHTFGIPSIAFSRAIPLEHQRSSDFEALDWCAEQYHVRQLVEQVLEKGLPRQVKILNVNFPLGLDQETEVRLTEQADMNFGSYVKPLTRSLDEGFQLAWEQNEQVKYAAVGTDIHAVHRDRVVSVTPISPLMTVEAPGLFGE